MCKNCFDLDLCISNPEEEARILKKLYDPKFFSSREDTPDFGIYQCLHCENEWSFERMYKGECISKVRNLTKINRSMPVTLIGNGFMGVSWWMGILMAVLLVSSVAFYILIMR